MTDRHLVVGAGPVGRHVAQLLAERGSHVTVTTRSGTDTGIADVDHVALDASDADALSTRLEGVDVLYNCANPGDYTKWEQVWPPLAAAMLTAAQRSGVVYAITGNLYPYGPVDGPMVESLPDAATDHKGRLRAKMWADALAAGIPTVEVRASDYMGVGVGQNGHVSRQVPGARKGRRAWVIGSPDLPHAFTDVLDQARTLIAAAEDPTSHGRTWLTPSNPAVSQRQALTDVLASGGLEPVSMSSVPLLGLLGRTNALLGEIKQLDYQWTRPYLVDDSAARAHFGIEPTPWDEVCRRTLTGN